MNTFNNNNNNQNLKDMNQQQYQQSNLNNNQMNINNQNLNQEVHSANNNNKNEEDINLKKSFSIRGSIFHDFKNSPFIPKKDEPEYFTISEGLFEYAQKISDLSNNYMNQNQNFYCNNCQNSNNNNYYNQNNYQNNNNNFNQQQNNNNQQYNNMINPQFENNNQNNIYSNSQMNIPNNYNQNFQQFQNNNYNNNQQQSNNNSCNQNYNNNLNFQQMSNFNQNNLNNNQNIREINNNQQFNNNQNINSIHHFSSNNLNYQGLNNNNNNIKQYINNVIIENGNMQYNNIQNNDKKNYSLNKLKSQPILENNFSLNNLLYQEQQQYLQENQNLDGNQNNNFNNNNNNDNGGINLNNKQYLQENNMNNKDSNNIIESNPPPVNNNNEGIKLRCQPKRTIIKKKKNCDKEKEKNQNYENPREIEGIQSDEIPQHKDIKSFENIDEAKSTNILSNSKNDNNNYKNMEDKELCVSCDVHADNNNNEFILPKNTNLSEIKNNSDKREEKSNNSFSVFNDGPNDNDNNNNNIIMSDLNNSSNDINDNNNNEMTVGYPSKEDVLGELGEEQHSLSYIKDTCTEMSVIVDEELPKEIHIHQIVKSSLCDETCIICYQKKICEKGHKCTFCPLIICDKCGNLIISHFYSCDKDKSLVLKEKNNFKCNICQKSDFQNKFCFTNDDYNYSICPSCYLPNRNKNEEEQIHEHLLINDDNISLVCKVCGQIKKEGYKCNECELEICGECYKDIMNKKKNTHLHEHKMLLWPKENWKCKNCENSGGKVAFICKKCNFDLCLNCFLS